MLKPSFVNYVFLYTMRKMTYLYTIYRNILLAALVVISVSFGAQAQDKNVTLPANWFNLDLAKDGYFGIGTEKAYNELLKNKKPKERIIVAVIDGGTDITHEDLKGVIWTNKKEIPGNGIDDDNNGYVDDVHGWNFIGSKKGNLEFDNLEMVRVLRKLAPKYASTLPSTVLDSTQKEEFAVFQKARTAFGKKYDDASQTFSVIEAINKVLDSVVKVTNKPFPSLDDIDNYKADNDQEEQVKTIIRKASKESGGMDKFFKEMKKAYHDYDVMLKYNLNPKYDQRKELVGDNYEDSHERFYGNNDVTGPSADHGTHVAGIIAANRHNDLGIMGVADNVSIMVVRIVPEGDERDKDVANGIRYAVDNGARVINMSFGKGFKSDKKVVDEAVKYAQEKGVLLVHAAGNDNENNDDSDNFPNKYFETPESIAYKKAHQPKPPVPFRQMDNRTQPSVVDNNGFNRTPKPAPVDTAKFQFPHANNWIEVGASSYKDNDDLKASFSNYGRYLVDVFAPGFMINSTVPGSKYEEFDGTSMAAPVVSGMSATILSYYPHLSPAQVRDIIIKSAVKVTHKIKYENTKGEKVRGLLSDISVSGGIANLYNALKLAETYK